ncbi:MAG: hypothetical protein LUC90_03210 [Lachnospiraceae bacterium]|nr:hypothetical protein [Lachnospiraceae bacterium]
MKMTKEEMVIREIIGPGRGDTNALSCAVQVAEQLLFEGQKGSCISSICVTRDIYAVVAEGLGRRCNSTARQIQRMCERCWDYMDEEQKLRYIGKSRFSDGAPGAQDMIFYFAFYCHYGESYYQVLRREVGL